MIHLKKEEWFSNIRTDVLAGLVVGLALIPESIAFSAIAGVDPQVGLYASFCIAVSIAFFGGRPAMISAATGAMALLMITLVKDHGLQYLLAATVLTGIIQIIAGYFKVAKLMRFVSQSVVYGFLNALAILIFAAQLPEMSKMDATGFVFVALGLAIIYLFPYIPKIGKAIPSPLICIAVLSGLALLLGADMRTVSDLGHFPDTLPIFLIPDIPLNFETLTIVLPYTVTLATVGLLETMMTTTVVDEVTETSSDRHQECRGQGMANLVAIMVMVAFTTFQWGSVKQFNKHRLAFNVVMIAVVLVVLATHNLALGVFVGVMLSALFFINQLESTVHVYTHVEENKRHYVISGQIFFSSADKFYQFFDFNEQIKTVELNLTHAHIWDVTSVNMFNNVVQKFQAQGIEVIVTGLNEASSTLIDRYQNI